MILKAAWVVPVTLAPIRAGYLEIDEERIVGVGAASTLPPTTDEVVDLGAAVLMPGLVNPHTHLELGCYALRFKPAPFWKWIEQLIRLRSEPGQWEREQRAVIEGAWQSLKAGVTCVGDISRRNCSWSVLKGLPIRKVCFVELLTLADHPPRNVDELRSGIAEVVEDELLTVGVSPHAPYTVPAGQIRAALGLADELRRPWTMHLAETQEEEAFLRGQKGVLSPTIKKLLDRCDIAAPGCSPIDLLSDCCPDDCRGSLAHVNYAAEDEIERLAEAGHVVIYCPRAHRFFRHEPHPFMRMRAAGVPVTFGTDSLASNSSLSVLDELHYVHTQVADRPSPEELLRMATLDAAGALRLDQEIGSLEAGKQADLAAFPCAADAPDPLSALLESPMAPSAVWVAGGRVV